MEKRYPEYLERIRSLMGKMSKELSGGRTGSLRDRGVQHA